MIRTSITAAAVALAVALTAPAALARPDTVMDWPLLEKMTDTDKDKMVSKKEFLDAMSRAYDMALKEMGKKPNMVKDDKLTMEAYKELIRQLYSGA